MAGASSGWASSLDEADVGAELPCKLVDFLRGVSFPPSRPRSFLPSFCRFEFADLSILFVLSFVQTNIPENPQTLSSPDLFTYHPPDCTE